MKKLVQTKGTMPGTAPSPASFREGTLRKLRSITAMLAAVIVFMIAGGNMVFAQTFTATLSSNQTYIRPTPGATVCGASSYGTFTSVSAGSSTFSYATQAFTVATSGNYTIAVTANTISDPMLMVYTGSFSPGSPLSNFKVGDDDSYGSLRPSIACQNSFSAGSTYVIVSTSYSSGAQNGTMTFSITGPAAVQILPTVSTSSASGISYTSVTLGGNVTSSGGATVTSRGVAWGTSPNPTSGTSMGSGTGSFSQVISGLNANTTYYARAYATNSVGTAYGTQISFTTLNYVKPSVSTSTINSITSSSAGSGGNVTSDGGASVSSRGIVYSTSPSPTLSNYIVYSGSGTGSFTAGMSGLNPSTRYYVRAFATNVAGTSYGGELSFVTNHIVTYNAGPNGSISGTATQSIAHGGSGTAIMAVPAANYSFLTWSDGSTINPRTEINVSTSKTLTANFVLNHLVFDPQPLSSVAGQNIPFTVRIVDNYGNTMSNSDGNAITIALVTNPGGGTLDGTLTLTPTGGMAVSGNVWIDKTGSGYRLSAITGLLGSTTSGTFGITPAALDHFTVSGITDPVVAGTTTTPAVTAYDMFDNIKTNYTGTIVFTSDDPQADLPSDYTFIAGDNGVKSITNGLALKTTGEHSVTVADNGSTGSQTEITVTPADINHFTLTVNGAVVAGTPFTVTATVYDTYGNLKTNYDGNNNVTWTTTATTSPKGNAREMPANGDQAFTQGAATISGFTFYNSGETPTITITDGPTASPGTTAPITVLNAPLDNFLVVAGTAQAAGIPFDVTVTARDVYWNTCIDYTGSIRFKSSEDSLVSFPAGLQPYSLPDQGVRTFTGGIEVNTTGAYWLRAADAAFAFKSGEQQNIVVGPGAFSTLAAHSALTVDHTTRIAGEYVTVTAIPRDVQGNLLYDCRDISILLDSAASDYDGPIAVQHAGDGSYTATVRVTRAGINTISGRFNSTGEMFDQTREITVLTAPVDLAHTMITANPATMTTDEQSQITVQLKDAFDNNLTTSDGIVTLTTTRGVLTGGVTDNLDGTYSATLYGNFGAAGTATISGEFAGNMQNPSINGPITDTEDVEITEGLPALATTTITAIPDSMTTDETSTITVQLKDQFGNLIINDRSTVTLNTTLGVLSGVMYAGAGTYTATLAGNSSGTGIATITGELSGVVSGPIDDDATVVITEGMPSLVTTSVEAVPATMTTDETSAITVQLKDQFGNLLTTSRGTVTLATTLGILTPVTDNGDGTYSATLSANHTGTGTADITGALYGNALIQTSSVTITDGLPNLVQSTITAVPLSITTDETSMVTVQLKDQWGNNIRTGRGAVTLSTTLGALTTVTDNNDGTYTAVLSADLSGTGTATITGNITGDVTGPFTDTEEVEITEGLPDLTMTEIITDPTAITADEQSTITVRLKDHIGNYLTSSRGSVTLNSNLAGSSITPVIDNGDGTYTATFSMISTGVGLATITGHFTGTGNAVSVNGPISDIATIEVTHGLATQLTIMTQPSTTAIAGVLFTQQPVIRIEDQFSNLVTGDNTTVVTATRFAGTDVLKGDLTATSSGGIATFTGLYYTKAEEITIGFTSNPVLTPAISSAILVLPAPAAYFTLNAPPNFTAGATRASYQVTRYDEFANLVTASDQTVYLFSSSTGLNKRFYNASTGGSIITQVSIADGSSSTPFWYYDEKTGNHTITASDASPSDGSTGIDDASDEIMVTPSLLKDFLVYGVPNPHNLGTWQSVTVEARDTYNNRKTNYIGTITFSNTDISATNPPDYQFQLADLGIHTFTNELQFSQPGNWWLTAIDMAEPTKYGAQADIIVQRAVTITANDRNKTYGDEMIMGTTEFSIAGIVPGADPVPGEITGVTLTSTGSTALADVGAYSITPSDATGTYDPIYYNIMYSSSGILTVNPATLVITADAGQSKIYGDADPMLTYSVSGLMNGQTESIITGSMVRDSGELTGTYPIAQGTLDAGLNYTITFVPDIFSITQKQINITADAGQYKIYGSLDPLLTYHADPLAFNDVFTGAPERISGEAVAPNYSITIGTLTIEDAYGMNVAGNYDITYTGDLFGILPLNITVTADAGQSKVYGQADPVLTYTSVPAEGSVLPNADTVAFSGVLMRAPGETAGIYPIGQGSLTNSNYNINFTGDNFIITQLAITGNFTVEPTKVYDQTTDAVILTRTLNGVIGTDDVNLTGGTAHYSDKNVGIAKTVTLTGMSLSGTDAGNYTLSGVATTTADITPRSLNLTYFGADSKVYDGTVLATGVGFQDDRISGDYLSFQREAEFDTKDVGINKPVYYSNIAITGGADRFNYVLASTTGTAWADITARALTITADDQSKCPGQLLTFNGAEFSAPALVPCDTLNSVSLNSTGAASGAAPGTYPILPSAAVGTGLSNYDITYADGTLTVNNISAAPTGNTLQAFCNAATVNDLTATGSGILWYDASTGGNLLALSAPVVHGIHYYASQTIIGCESTDRLDVTAEISTPPAPAGNTIQVFCQAGTVAGLIVTGSSIIWYDAASGGNVLSTSEPLTHGTHYYASQTIAGCESMNRLDVIAVLTSPPAPTGNALQVFCNAATIADLVATGTDIQWYDASTGGNVLLLSDPLANGLHYYASQTVGGCESMNRLDVVADITSLPAPTGDIVQSFCNAAAVADLVATGSNIIWYDAATGGNTLPPTAGLVNAAHYYASQNIGGCESALRLDVTADILTTPAPTGDPIQTFCNAGTVANLIAVGASIIWYDAPTGGNILQPTTALVNGMHYYASQNPAGCESAGRLEVSVLFTTPPPPTANPAQTFCNAATVANLAANGTDILWYEVATGGIPLTEPTPLTNGTHYFASQKVNGCESSGRFEVVVTINTAAAPAGSAIQHFCQSGTVADLTVTGTNIIWYDSEAGSNIISPSTPLVNGTHYYASQTIGGCESMNRLDVAADIISPNPPIGNPVQSFCDAATIADLTATGSSLIWYDSTTGGNILPPSAPLIHGTHYFASQTIGGCESTGRLEVMAEITITPAPTGNAVQTFCNSGMVADLIATGSNIQWYDAATGGNLLSPSVLLVNGRQYYASQTLGGCESAARLEVTTAITVTPAPTGSAIQSFCHSGVVGNLSATGTDIIWYDAATGGNVLPSGTILIHGVHYFASQTVSGCESADRLDVIVEIIWPLAPTGNSIQSFCNTAIVSDIVVTGSNIKWYDAAMGGNLLAPSQPLINGARYYASQTVNGCESEDRLDVMATLNASSSSTVDHDACDIYMWFGNMYTQSGAYTHSLTNTAGCDSVITLNLTINKSSSESIDTIVCDSYISPSGLEFTTSGTYTDTIPNVAGCDSIISIDLTVTTCTGIAAHSAETIRLYPNPVAGILTIEGIESAMIEVLDIKGKVLMSTRSDDFKTCLNMGTLANGIYFVRISQTDNIYIHKIEVKK